MTDSRSSRRLAAWLLLALAVGGAGIGAWRRATRSRADDSVTARTKAPAPARVRALRVESMGKDGSAPRTLPSARPSTVKVDHGPAFRESKAISPFHDSPAARETASLEERTPGGARKSIQLSREEVLKQREGMYGFASHAYGTTLGKGSVELSLPLILKETGQPRLSYDFLELRAGGATLASGGVVPARATPEERAVSFDRGAVEERYLLRPDALEQTFVIRSLPAARGALTLTGRISTNLSPPTDGSAGPKLPFTAGGREILTLSEAVAVDAAGRRLDLELAYSGGIVTLTVPADWVAAAALPIVIDPLMGGPATVDASVTDAIGLVQGVPVRITDVAYNTTAGEWLVVWQEQFGGSAFNFDVYAQRVSATGNLAGSAIPVAVTGAGEYEPTVSWAAAINRYLVAWRHDPADDASDADQFIAGQVCTSGRPIGDGGGIIP